MNTKDAITASAMKLFNRNGCLPVTTRHIAEEMNISPGNLYYHYRNKEEIIRVIFDMMIEDFNAIYRTEYKDKPFRDVLNGVINDTGLVIFKYRFFFMELPILLGRDQQLKKMYMKIKQERFSDFHNALMMLETKGILAESLSDEEFLLVAENCWALAEFMLQSMYVRQEKITQESIVKNFFRVMHIIKPYIKKEFREMLL